MIVLFALAVVVALAGAGAWWLWQRRSPKRRALAAPSRPRLPVVLAHGFLGFDEIAVGGSRFAYFRGVVERLEQLGITAHTVRMPASAPIAVRAAELATLVRSLPGRVNVIAHSMGGLDARYAISQLGIADRVASLTTIGTPHQGTPIADLGAGWVRRLRLDRALTPMLDVAGLHDLTTTRMKQFNRDVRDHAGVAYLSVVARTPRGRVNPLLKVPHRYMQHYVGDNDGVVPAESQLWGELMREIEADHWAQIGWAGDFDAAAFFGDIMYELRDRGF
jgi:triacylglycerol lipase